MNARANGEDTETQDFDGNGNITAADALDFLNGRGNFLNIKKYFKTKDLKITPYNSRTCKNNGTNCTQPPNAYNMDGSLFNNTFYQAPTGLFLADGSYIQLATTILFAALGADNGFHYTAIVDVNGPFKKPNRVGYDIFGFYISSKGNVVPMGYELNIQTWHDEDTGEDYSWLEGGNNCRNIAPYGLCVTASAIKGKNPDGSDYFKNIKYWDNVEFY